MFSLSLSSHPQDLASSKMRLLYLTGGKTTDVDAEAQIQLTKLEGTPVEVLSVDSPVDALAAIQKDGAAFRALLTSPSLSEKDTIELIISLRKAQAPIGIVPVVTEAHRGLCSSAVAAGADAVLLMLNGGLIDPRETLGKLKQRSASDSGSDKKAPSAVAATQRALSELRKLHTLLHTKSPAEGQDRPDLQPVEAARMRLEARLNDAHAAAARMSTDEPKPDPTPIPTVHTAPSPKAGNPKGGSSKAGPAWRRSSATEPQPPKRWNDKLIEGATRAAFEGALQSARTELRQAVESHTADRREWEAQKAQARSRPARASGGPKLEAGTRADVERNAAGAFGDDRSVGA